MVESDHYGLLAYCSAYAVPFDCSSLEYTLLKKERFGLKYRGLVSNVPNTPTAALCSGKLGRCFWSKQQTFQTQLYKGDMFSQASQKYQQGYASFCTAALFTCTNTIVSCEFEMHCREALSQYDVWRDKLAEMDFLPRFCWRLGRA